MDKIILISGKSGSGKDASAQIMKNVLEAHNKRVLIIHYGDAVKFVIKEYFGWNGQKDEYGRGLLQRIGTDVVRKRFPNFWVVFVAQLIESFKDEFDVAIVPDARFENEIEALEEICGISTCVRIERTNPDGSAWVNPLFTKEQLQHPSETSLDSYVFDYIVHNDGNITDLEESVTTLLNDMRLV